MSDLAIKVSNLGKEYHIGLARSGDFRENFSRRINHLFGKSLPGESFWALRNASFEIKKGQAFGIIGKNGAGKSTLLKILSRITEPTEGRFEINGRVSSLLEVGTGFHPELTGRENIYLNGTILGMTRREVKSKFEEIVAFSGIEEFLDTPVKRYSSGMSVRLAFSVAAHLEPEILIIDEVLAVGDADFQKKCIGKMGEVTSSGRTIIFVSHNMTAVQNLCEMGILLKNGEMDFLGPVQDCIKTYFQKGFDQSKEIPLLDRKDRQGNASVLLKNIDVLVNGQSGASIRSGTEVLFRFELQNKNRIPIRNLRLDIGINGSFNERLSWCSTEFLEKREFDPNVSHIDLLIPDFPLNEGRYSLTLYLVINGGISDWIRDALFFDVEPGDFHGIGRAVDQKKGKFLFNYEIMIGG
jgi:homopolymeric O-antigen transport system ATP-binding protein